MIIVLDRDVSRFALVLAGHPHGGQIRFPLSGLETRTRAKRYVEDRYRLPHGGWLHVSGGVGPGTSTSASSSHQA